MAIENEKDILWEIIMYLTDTFGYRTELVFGENSNFDAFLMIVIPINPEIISYMKIKASTVIEEYKRIGEEALYDELDKSVNYYLEKLHKKWGEFM